ncbi:MAG: hypothetical protein WBK75_01410 [Acutalibacteraceae bacterium]|nr:hypothetical protein [Clostridiales bacterium]
MRKIKKSFALILALSIVFIMGMSTMSASALLFKKPAKDTTTEEVGEAKKREPILSFYVSYDVVKEWEYHFRFGNPPTTTTEPTTEEPTVEETTVEETTQEIVDIEDPSVPLASAPVEQTVAPQTVVVKDAPVPKSDIPSTGEAGIAGVVALTAISAAAFVIAKKK